MGDYTIIANGILADQFNYNENVREIKRQELDIADEFVIGHVGRFALQKNYKLILKVFSEYLQQNKAAVLLLVGQGELFEVIRQLAIELHIEQNVRFLGVRTDIDELYQAMDVFFFPSLFEGLGIVAIEAQTSGLPCLLSSNLQNDLNITENVFRCDLSAGIQDWVDCLDEIYATFQYKRRTGHVELIRKAGYDSDVSIYVLEKLYTKQ